MICKGPHTHTHTHTPIESINQAKVTFSSGHFQAKAAIHNRTLQIYKLSPPSQLASGLSSALSIRRFCLFILSSMLLFQYIPHTYIHSCYRKNRRSSLVGNPSSQNPETLRAYNNNVHTFVCFQCQVVGPTTMRSATPTHIIKL